jgi:hypothetical protein
MSKKIHAMAVFILAADLSYREATERNTDG